MTFEWFFIGLAVGYLSAVLTVALIISPWGRQAFFRVEEAEPAQEIAPVAPAVKQDPPVIFFDGVLHDWGPDFGHLDPALGRWRWQVFAHEHHTQVDAGLTGIGLTIPLMVSNSKTQSQARDDASKWATAQARLVDPDANAVVLWEELL